MALGQDLLECFGVILCTQSVRYLRCAVFLFQPCVTTTKRDFFRIFSDRELETLRIIDCLKESGLEIREIRKFMQWCAEGSSSYPQRRELFENQKKTVEKEIERLQKTLDMLRFKCWYYDTAIADGNEDRINEMIPNNLPEDIQKLYDHAHSDDED